MLRSFSNRWHHHCIHFVAVFFLRVLMLIFHGTHPNYKITLLSVLKFDPAWLLFLSWVCALIRFFVAIVSSILLFSWILAAIVVFCRLFGSSLFNKLIQMNKVLSFIRELTIFFIASIILWCIGFAKSDLLISIYPICKWRLLRLSINWGWIFWINCPFPSHLIMFGILPKLPTPI